MTLEQFITEANNHIASKGGTLKLDKTLMFKPHFHYTDHALARFLEENMNMEMEMDDGDMYWELPDMNLAELWKLYASIQREVDTFSLEILLEHGDFEDENGDLELIVWGYLDDNHIEAESEEVISFFNDLTYYPEFEEYAKEKYPDFRKNSTLQKMKLYAQYLEVQRTTLTEAIEELS